MVVSALAFGGAPKKALMKAFGNTEICVSPRLLNEYRDVPFELTAKKKIDKEQLKALIAGMAAFVSEARVVFPKKVLEICRDPKDNMVLECCDEAGADILITGDKDLLDIQNPLTHLQILAPGTFLKSNLIKGGSIHGSRPNETVRKVKADILDDLSSEARKWKDRKNSMEYNDDSDLWWEVKAKAVLLDEAWRLVDSITISHLKTLEEFYVRFLDSVHNHKEWGWGSNWPDEIHYETLSYVKRIITRNFPDDL